VFNNLGVRILRDARESSLIVMDELGFMESEALAFREEVLRLLDGDAPVLGVLKSKHTPFLDQVRVHTAVKIIEVTEKNRDEIPQMLTEIFGCEILQP
jgi:nucleoside-triphosphatase